MKRAITSLKKASNELLKEIAAIYPKGVDDDDLVSFPTTNGSNIRAIEIEMEDTIYLVKLDDESFYRKFIAKDEEDEDEEDDDKDDDMDDLDEIDDMDEDDSDDDEEDDD